MTEPSISEYARSLVADVQATAEAERTTTPEAFTSRVLFDLEQAGVLTNTFTAYHKTQGHEVHGYGMGEDGTSLDLFISDFDLAPLERKLTRAQVETAFRRLLTFVKRCRDGLRKHIDEAFDVYDMCGAVEKALGEVERIRLILFTDLVCTATEFQPIEFDGLPVLREVWDLARLHRHETSGTLGEPIVVSFSPPLPCVSAPSSEPDHSVVLAVISGDMLADLYAEHGASLLELNVRSFLQARGAVNRGIRETILKLPGRFLAYNNGITATASEVEFGICPGGQPGISLIRGLQIVNGGQTTASLHYAKIRDKADLAQVAVQMKLTEVSPDRLADIVPKISEYSNTQNRVTQVDFSSNHEYHVSVQRITRSLWAPASSGSAQETHWFYERARGQYTDELAKARTSARQIHFRQLNPTRQMFKKSDLANYVHSWEQLPHLVSRGAQKNFVEFMLRLEEQAPRVDILYCQRVIAMAILFNTVDQIARGHGAGSLKRAVTAYTMARLSLATGQRLDLDQIWREQRVSPTTRAAIDALCPLVMEEIKKPRKVNNVGEWAKRGTCWDGVSRVTWVVPDDLAAELRDTPLDPAALAGGEPGLARLDSEMLAVAVEEWFAIARWAKETRNLEPWQRQLTHAVARRLELDEEVPDTQAAQVMHVRDEAYKLGFRPLMT